MMPKRSHSIFNLPNSLTLFRVACVPLLVFLLFFPHKLTSFLAAAVFGLASISDLLDGFLARRRQMVTTFGVFLDPLADKLVVSAALIMLIPLGRVPAWMVVVIVGRELAITGLRSVAVSEGKIIGADELGKKKMVFQIVAVLGLLLHYDYFGVDFHAVGMFFMWMAVILTLWSGINYFRSFWHVLEESETDEPHEDSAGSRGQKTEDRGQRSEVRMKIENQEPVLTAFHNLTSHIPYLTSQIRNQRI